MRELYDNGLRPIDRETAIIAMGDFIDEISPYFFPTPHQIVPVLERKFCLSGDYVFGVVKSALNRYYWVESVEEPSFTAHELARREYWESGCFRSFAKARKELAKRKEKSQIQWSEFDDNDSGI